MTTIKLPACYDISHYETIVDFNALEPRPALVIAKATEGTVLVDSMFYQYFDGMYEAGLIRGAYHFFRKAADAVTQANFFLAAISGKVTVLDVLVLDVEEGGETEAQLVDFLQTVKSAYPNNLIMIYSRVNILNLIATTQNYLKQFPIWTAGYPYEPDKFNAVPESYVPDPDRWGPVWLWQYADNGIVSGISGAVDLNWISPAMRYWLGVDIKDVELWFGSMALYERGYRESPRPFYYHTVRFHRDNVARVQVSDADSLRSTPYYLKTRGCHIAINGDHGSPGPPAGLGLSDGRYFKNTTSEKNIQWDADHNLLGIAWSKLPDAYNAVGISQVLLEDGLIPSTLDDISVDPRTSLFWNATEYMIVMIDGRNNGTLGLTRVELARFAREFGMTDGGNLDGGDSSTLVFRDVTGEPIVKNNLPDGVAHWLTNHVGFWLEAGSPEPPVDPPQGDETMQYEVQRKVGVRPRPSMYATHEPAQYAQAGYAFDSDATQTVTESIDGKQHTVTWVQLPSGSWAPMEYRGVVYVVEHVVVPPPVDPPVGVYSTPAGTIQINTPDGGVLHNRDEVVWE